MTKQFSDQEQNEYYNRQPSKRVGGGMWLEDSQGRLMIVKPSYKKGWAPVGGVVDANESPLDGAIRETTEEIGITLAPDRLTLAGYRYTQARNGRDEDTNVFFRAQLTDAEIAAIKLQPEELTEYKFVTKEELSQYADTPRIQALVAAWQGGEFPFYIHNETRIL